MDNTKDGHTDVASSRRMCQTIIEDAQEILDALPSSEMALPTWWTNKLAKCSAYINGARDYIVYTDMGESVSEENEEMDRVVINFTEDDDMIPPSAKMVMENGDASEKGEISENDNE